MKSYFKRILSLLIWVILATAATLAVRFLLNACYEALHSRFGNIFPLYNPITDKAGYQVFSRVIETSAYGISVFIFVYISLLTDNERYEYIIGKTEGLYTVIEGFPLYTGKYIASDITASVISGIALTLPVVFIPDRLFSLSLLAPLKFPRTIISFLPQPFGTALGAILLSATAILAHFPAILFSLKAWRARWLTAFSE